MFSEVIGGDGQRSALPFEPERFYSGLKPTE